MNSSECCGGKLARRSVLTAAVAGTASIGLAACAGAAEPSAAPTQSASASPSDTGASPTQSDSPTAVAATVLGATSAVEVGGGAKFPVGEGTVIVTQPQAGEFVAFDARCTHQGCVVSGVSEGEIRCGCHGAKFDIATGEVRGGPAESPLKAVKIAVVNDEIVLEN
jgi:Rieske Fe-S protein